MLTDTHCHLDFDWFEQDRQAVLDRAWRAGITRILIPQVELPISKVALSLAESDPRIFLSVGIHPNSAQLWNDDALNTLRKLASHPKVLAIGEIGLDYYRDHTTPEMQKKILLEQLKLAAEINKPVILHCRDAFKDLYEILLEWVEFARPVPNSKFPAYGVFHSFSGSSYQAQHATQLGFYLGVTGNVTYKNSEALRESIIGVDLDKLLIETDAPFLTPVPYRGKRNEPSYIQHINAKLAALFSTTPERTAKMTYNNAVNLFKW